MRRLNNLPVEYVTPNKFDIRKKRRSGEGIWFVDDENRVYSLLSTQHKLYRGWEESGSVDESKFAISISLPRRSMKSQDPPVEFPPIGHSVNLTEIATDVSIGTFIVKEYPEKITTKSRSTSVILEKE